MDTRQKAVTDEWGGVDKNVQRIVAVLNDFGFKTIGSCEGHIDHGSPAPWISIRATEKGREKIGLLLGEFYRNRSVPGDIRLMLMSSNSGFWLHNGGAAYDEWRVDTQKNAERIAKGEETKPQELSEEEKRIRAKKLPIFQREMDEFASFLLSRSRVV